MPAGVSRSGVSIADADSTINILHMFAEDAELYWQPKL